MRGWNLIRSLAVAVGLMSLSAGPAAAVAYTSGSFGYAAGVTGSGDTGDVTTSTIFDIVGPPIPPSPVIIVLSTGGSFTGVLPVFSLLPIGDPIDFTIPSTFDFAAPAGIGSFTATSAVLLGTVGVDAGVIGTEKRVNLVSRVALTGVADGHLNHRALFDSVHKNATAAGGLFDRTPDQIGEHLNNTRHIDIHHQVARGR